MRYLVGMSGGLDSSSAARALIEQGHLVEGAYLKMFDGANADAAENTCEELGIPLRILDCRQLFEKTVIENFVDCYRKGLTPNPCVECNRYVKISVLCSYANAHDFDRVATGHYASVKKTERGRFCILRSENEKKDQSYMLWGLSQEQLSLLEFPLFSAEKEELRAKASAAGMKCASAKESMDICFLPDGNYGEFVEERGGVCPPGDFVDKSGKILGQHRGIVHYTVGQRKHLGIATGVPMYVSDIDPIKNRIILTPSSAEYKKRIRVERINFQAVPPMREGEMGGLTVKLRYAQKPLNVRCYFDSKGVTAVLEKSARGVTPGQSAVFYLGNQVAFGGYIQK